MPVIINEVEVVSNPQSQTSQSSAAPAQNQQLPPASVDQHNLEKMLQRFQSRMARLLVY